MVDSANLVKVTSVVVTSVEVTSVEVISAEAVMEAQTSFLDFSDLQNR